MPSTGLTRSTVTPTSRKIFTFSAWVKKTDTDISDNQALFSITNADGLYFIDIRFHHTNEQLEIIDYQNGTQMFLRTNRVFRDASAWYHIVVTVDTTNATADDRIKMYVNGVQETSFASRTNPSLNHDTNANGTNTRVGYQNSQYYFDGSMAHVHFIDGTAYTPSAFGETDATTGIWKPKTAPSVTYGTNGFFLKFENSGAFGTDSSGNANNFTVNGTMTQTIDTPSNVFATMNPLDNYYAGATFEHGNTEVITTQSAYTYCTSTLKMGSGKYYIEGKWTGTGGGNSGVGIVNTSSTATSDEMTTKANGSVIKDDGAIYENGSYTGTNLGSFSVNDIVMIAFDGGNNAIYYGKNGTWLNSGDPTSGASKTGAFTPSSTTGLDYFIGFGDQNSSYSYRIEFNFGNGYFGTTAVSSAENPDDGIGIFEYDVPAGYKALCTKSINSQEYD
jgi:hypothetical protein